MGGRFEIDREVGRGGGGVVYRAWDLVGKGWVALKVLTAQGDVTEQARFEREGRLLMSLRHPHIVRVLTCGSLDDGVLYVAMEWLSGEDLAARLRRGPVPLGHALEIGRQVADALDAAHRAGVIHRDIKPSNIFLAAAAGGPVPSAAGASGGPAASEVLVTAVSGYPVEELLPDSLPCESQLRPSLRPTQPEPHPELPLQIAILDTSVPDVKLVDFGVATEIDIHLTRIGIVVGTPAYMSPEQARAEKPIDARADVYSLGATLFELLTGRPPHVGPTAVATLARLITTRAPRASELIPIPHLVDELLARMLQTDPEARPATAAEVSETLQALLAAHRAGRLTEPPPVRNSQPVTQGTRMVTALVGLGLADAIGRSALIEHLRTSGADAAPLGHEGIVAYVGARRALGGEAVRAIELGRTLAELGGRVGIATGRSQIDLSRPVGDVVDRAAGLAHAADRGQMLTDATTTELARGHFEFLMRAGGNATVGAPAAKRADHGGAAPFLGREVELAQVLGAYERCCDEETAVIVTIGGPPGIGKSRLGREVLAHINTSADPPRIVSVRCDPFGRGQALGAAADVVRGLVGVQKGLSLDAVRAAIGEIESSDSAVGAGQDLLARLVADAPLGEGFDALGAGDVLWMEMTAVALAALGKTPVVCVVEDVQWADIDSVRWVEHLVSRALGRKLCILLLARPEFLWDPARAARMVDGAHVRVDLRPITKRAVRGIAKAILGERSNDTVLDIIASQACGSPLFAEELARATTLGRDAQSAPTIEAAIQVSLDALGQGLLDAIACLSVFGMAGWDGGLEALGIDRAAERLRDLAAANLVMEHAESRLPRAREWGFKHALVRDVAYASLGPARAKRLHGLAAEWLAQSGEDAARVAEHFDLGERHAEAASFWERAARRGLTANALSEAVRMAERALAYADDKHTAFARAQLLDEAWSRLDPRAADRETAIVAMRDAAHDTASSLRTEGARARYDHARGTGLDVTERLIQVRDGAGRHGLVDEEARCTATLAARYAFSGELSAAERESHRLLKLAEGGAVACAAVDGWQTLAIVYQTRGQLVSALDARRNAALAARAAGLKEREGTLDVNVGFALTTMGAKHEAREALADGLAIAHTIGSPEAVRHARMNLLGWTATFGRDANCDDELAEPRAEADQSAGRGWVTHDRATLGLLFYRACELLDGGSGDDLRRASLLLETAVDGYRRTGNNDVLPVALATWARAEHLCGNRATARSLADRARTLLEKGAFSLLNEAPVYLALHAVCVAENDVRGAHEAVVSAMSPLARRLAGVAGTPYAKTFLTELRHNVELLALARHCCALPESIAVELAKAEAPPCGS